MLAKRGPNQSKTVNARWAMPTLPGCYPTLRAEDLANVWTYVRLSLSEIVLDIAQNEP
jgi:hypothetical protein